MNIRLPFLTAVLLAPQLCAAGAEPNPFSAAPAAAKNQTPAGESFISVVEHVIVPARQLDQWLEAHPTKGDATELRAQVQLWVDGGTATLDCTALSNGTFGRECLNDSLFEQVYSSEYQAASSDEWPFPHEITTRMLGYSTRLGACIENGIAQLRASLEFVQMRDLQSGMNELQVQTHQAGDIFMPRFNSMSIRGRMPAQGNAAPDDDPFTGPSSSPEALQVSFLPGHIWLAGRFDEPAQWARMGKAGKDHSTVAGEANARLVFFRGDFIPLQANAKPDALSKLMCSVKLYKVDHRRFSRWLQKTGLDAWQESAWARLPEWLEGEGAGEVASVSGGCDPGSGSRLGNTEEVPYAIAWQLFESKLRPGNLKNQGFRHPTAWDTRNIGLTLQATILPDANGPMLNFAVERVSEVGRSVLRRVHRDGSWVPDITSPEFSTNWWKSDTRIIRGKWLLVGSGAEMGAGGKADPSTCLLVFLRLD